MRDVGLAIFSSGGLSGWATRKLSSPVRSIQRPILNRFGDVLRLDLGRAVQVGNRARDFKDAVVGAGAQALLLHGPLQQALAVAGEFAIGANLARSHLRIAENPLCSGSEAVELNLSRLQYSLANRRRIFRTGVAAQLL